MNCHAPTQALSHEQRDALIGEARRRAHLLRREAVGQAWHVAHVFVLKAWRAIIRSERSNRILEA